MKFHYFHVGSSVADALSSFYDFATSAEVNDILRADIPNLRFVMDGSLTVDLSGETETFAAGSVIVCGPTFHACNITLAAGTRIFGMSVLPLGWARLFPDGRDVLTNRFCQGQDWLCDEAMDSARSLMGSKDVRERMEAVTRLVIAQRNDDARVNADFLAAADDWLKAPGEFDVENLVERTGLSHRQVERLCKSYFGAGPKKLFRKFRALYAANQMMWQGVSDWRKVAASTYYDQAHFIREFKAFNGQTPREFLSEGPTLARLILGERQLTGHPNTFTVIS
ncbi:helix-turn-helix domain-containing protein [Parvularcula lutaonensis]|uniref:Helix-turn-helix domain-containing protein n=1 Tax=Parvularcula lutaonensis TaxID=491923 RepID=A0ABV7MEA1_9PROT|nr:AraC family transcriptional regulator [Parvularcula lutaonensis]GGY39209.1 hypothetical protein GCM10007148_04400 [Parvularcula lutaonensis]